MLDRADGVRTAPGFGVAAVAATRVAPKGTESASELGASNGT